MTLVPRQPPRLLGDLQQRGSITGLGDSITANVGNYPFLADEGYLSWLVHRLGGRLQYVERAAAGGWRTDEILAVQLPLVVARTPKPTYVVVLAGVNDVSQLIATSTIIANLTTIYRRLRAVGIVPVCAAIPPISTSAANRAKVAAINTWIANHAKTNGYLFVDIHAALIDPATGSYASAYTSDGTHPNPLGAKVLGYAIADALSPYLPPWTPPLTNYDGDTSIGHIAGTFASGFTDANSDGLPDASTPRTGLFFQTGQSDTTITYTNRNGSGDRWLNIARTGAAAVTEIRGGGTGTSGATVTPGGKVALGLRFKLTGMSASNSVSIRFAQSNSSTTLLASALTSWNTDVDESVFYGVYDVPGNWPTAGRWAFEIAGPAGPTLSIAQLTTRDLTGQGVAE